MREEQLKLAELRNWLTLRVIPCFQRRH